MKSKNESTLVRFIELMKMADYPEMKDLLSDDLVAYLTNSKGEVDKLEGKTAYIQRFSAIDRPREIQMNIVQMVSLVPDQILMMLEVAVNDAGKSIVNHAAYLVKFDHKKIQEIWMVGSTCSP